MQSAIFRELIPGLELTDKEIMAKIKSDISRRIIFQERLNILNDKWKDIMSRELALMFSTESYNDMLPYIDVSNNLARRIVSEISVAYKNEPTRTVTPKGGHKRYEEISKNFRIDSKMQRTNELLNGLNDLIVMTAIFGRTIDLNIFTPNQFIVFENVDDPTQIDALAIEDKFMDRDGQERTQYCFWSPTRHFILDESGRKEVVPGNQSGLNPYIEQNVIMDGDEIVGVNFFPFTFLHKSERHCSFLDETSGTDLFEATKLVAMFNTFKAIMIPMQFKQLAVKKNLDDNTGLLKNLQIKSPLHVFESNGEISVLDWQSQLTQLDESIDRKITQIAGNYGISAENFKLTSTQTSGFARMIAKERLLEIREEQVKNYRNTEEDLFDSVRAANNLYSLGVEIPENAKFSIDFQEPHFPNDPMQEIALLEKRVQLGLTNLLELVKQDNPDIKSDEEAEEFIAKNIKIRNKLNNKFGAGFLTETINENSNPRSSDN